MRSSDVDTRQLILDTAQEHMARKGYAAVGLNEILTGAGVPKGSFYHYFPSKDAFGEALLKSYFDDYLGSMDELIADTTKDGAARVMEYWQRFHTLQSFDQYQGKCLVVKLGAEVSDLSEAMRVQLDIGTAGLVGRIEKLIAGGVADGTLSRDIDAAFMAATLYDLWVGASVMAKIQRRPEALDRALTTTRTLLHL
ncbi:TetR/AcrR family transcriptional regulator [Aeromicrobium chenweiae]|uniref:TetR family transcriptional regulator n=1 Tax=Aeromicrobium chenweiae TaxID=2079793 RepID=A0A2S0WM83_9ACTN|nr:TetR/AcrR family transcriptional regulator [Aeromicrobium chenweiae]AWB92412.1 TetR family transcriptional regulator [Aeromicrobium chenweiae]TGN31300.1 TetR/AcrR family transcriptional regulator [Aeromicrobium chenweiae]